MHRLILALLLLAPLTAIAEDSDSRPHSGPLFMKDMLGDREFFAPWGIGIDIFTMQQDYAITDLQFSIPGVGITDPSKIEVSNDVAHYDLKLDVWVTPFLNVFGLVGQMDADTLVDFSNAGVVGLPFPLTALPVSYDGTVYGLGFNLMYGGEHWFAMLNNTWTDSSLSGGFESSVKSYTAQPRLGLIFNEFSVWGGAMYLDTEEKHLGTIDLGIPGLPPVPFNVELESLEKWNPAVGAAYVFSPRAHVSLEIGFGDRTYTLFNATFRF